MVFVYLLALIGLLTLLVLAVVAVFGSGHHGGDEPGDGFDVALSAVARLQAGAWHAIQEIRELDSHRKE